MLTLPLLRSVVRLLPTDTEPVLRANLHTLRDEIEPEGIDLDVLRWISSIADRSGVVPDLALARVHYTNRAQGGHPDGPVALARLDELERLAPPLLEEAAFRVALDQHRETVMTDVTTSVLIEAANILRIGVLKRVLVNGTWQNVTVRGVEPALDHLVGGIRRLESRLKHGHRQGEFSKDMDAAMRQADKAARDPQGQTGILSGIDRIDDLHHGLKRGELALVLGFVGHLKSTFVLNWYYKAAVYQGKHVALVPLETPVQDVRDLLICLHATHQRFNFDPQEIRVTFDRLRAGILTPDEFNALKDVTTDLQTNTDYGRMLYKQPDDRMSMGDIRAWVESEQRNLADPIEQLVIDYLGLVDPEKGEASRDRAAELNRAIRLSKIMAMEFNNGRGIGVLSPFQSNREGYKEAEKAGGRYNLRALSMATEAERSADLVYYIYLDDTMLQNGEVAMGNLKARNYKMIIDQFRCYADPATRLIDNLVAGGGVVI